MLMPCKRSVFPQYSDWVAITEDADQDVQSEVIESVVEDLQSEKLDSASDRDLQSEDSASAGDENEHLVI